MKHCPFCREAIQDEAVKCRFCGEWLEQALALPETPESAKPVLKKKNPTVAAILALVLGPLGFLYIGWRYAVMLHAMFAVFAVVLVVFNIPVLDVLPGWLKYMVLFVLAWKAYKICSVRNHLVETENEHVAILNSFPVATMAASDFLVGLAMIYAVATGVWATVEMYSDGMILRAVLTLVVGTPMLAAVATFVFRLIGDGINGVALVLAGQKFKNIFRE